MRWVAVLLPCRDPSHPIRDPSPSLANRLAVMAVLRTVRLCCKAVKASCNIVLRLAVVAVYCCYLQIDSSVSIIS